MLDVNTMILKKKKQHDILVTLKQQVSSVQKITLMVEDKKRTKQYLNDNEYSQCLKSSLMGKKKKK